MSCKAKRKLKRSGNLQGAIYILEDCYKLVDAYKDDDKKIDATFTDYFQSLPERFFQTLVTNLDEAQVSQRLTPYTRRMIESEARRRAESVLLS